MAVGRGSALNTILRLASEKAHQNVHQRRQRHIYGKIVPIPIFWPNSSTCFGKGHVMLSGGVLYMWVHAKTTKCSTFYQIFQKLDMAFPESTTRGSRKSSGHFEWHMRSYG